MMTCNVISPQLMWFRKLRRSLLFTFIISIVVNIGMWFERYVIIVTSIHRDYLPSSWSMHYPSHIDLGVYVGTIGLFFVFFLLFARYFPVLALNEVKTILKSSSEYHKNLPDEHHHDDHGHEAHGHDAHQAEESSAADDNAGNDDKADDASEETKEEGQD